MPHDAHRSDTGQKLAICAKRASCMVRVCVDATPWEQQT